MLSRSDGYCRKVDSICVLLVKDNGAFIDKVVNTGIVPRFVEYLSFDSFPELQGESVWVLTNISSGTEEHVSP